MAHLWVTAAELSQPTHPDASYAIEVASWIMWRLSGEKYPGISSSTEWYGTDPVIYADGYPDDGGARAQYVLDGSQSIRRLRLRRSPILSVEAVTVGSDSLVPTDYFIANSAYLVLADNTYWRLSRGIEVEYTHGMNPPRAGVRAAVKLADEIILALNESADCRLPDRVQSISRSGVSYTILDPQDFIKEGRTGMYEVDLFLAAANPAHALKKPKVFSVDKPRGEIRR